MGAALAANAFQDANWQKIKSIREQARSHNSHPDQLSSQLADEQCGKRAAGEKGMPVEGRGTAHAKSFSSGEPGI